MDPARTDARLEAAIRAVPQWRGRDIGVTPLAIGRDERHFMIEVGDEPFVLRLARPQGAGLRIDATAEIEITRAAATAGVATEVLAAIPQLGCLVTRLAPGRRLTHEDLERDAVMVSLAGAVRALHACPPPASGRSPFGEARDLRRAATTHGMEMPYAEGKAFEIVAGIEQGWSTPARPSVACHGDLTPASLFLDGEQVWIVDYRWAGAGDAFEDLGSLAAHLELGQERIESLLGVYFGGVRDAHRARLGLMRVAAWYLAAMRELMRSPSATLGRDVAERHLARVIDEASDPRFEGWVAAVA
jgi:aminoglycoside phosphotransferase (APT) family kinase protein